MIGLKAGVGHKRMGHNLLYFSWLVWVNFDAPQHHAPPRPRRLQENGMASFALQKKIKTNTVVIVFHIKHIDRAGTCHLIAWPCRQRRGADSGPTAAVDGGRHTLVPPGQPLFGIL